MRFWSKETSPSTYILAMSGVIDGEPVAISVADVKEADIKTSTTRFHAGVRRRQASDALTRGGI
jgi:hypothetical protein